MTAHTQIFSSGMTTLVKAAEDLAKWLVKEGVDISQPVKAMVIRRGLLSTRGTDIRTLDKWTKLLTEEGKLREVPDGDNSWYINL
jgi:hypothetical protein